MTRVAIVHDVLASRAGAERLVVALAETFPDAPIYALIHEPDATFAEFVDHRIETSWLNHLGPLRRRYRAAAPAAALTFLSKRIEADVTICSTSGLSHHVRCTGAKLVYCHTPARWLHDPETYMQGFPAAVRVAAAGVRPVFARFDRAAMRGADRLLVNSTQIATEVLNVYGRDASVISPCSSLDLTGTVNAIPDLEPGFVLSPVRPLGYKRLDVLVEAARALPDLKFVHVGDGPHRGELARLAPPNFSSLGSVDDAQLRWAYRNASVAVLTCAEDFGLVPLEAAAHGLATIAPNARGLVDHPASLLSTYEFASVDALVAAIKGAPARTHRLYPKRLDRERFMTEIQTAVDELT